MPLNNQRCLGTTKLLSDSFSKDSASSSHNAVLDNMYMPPLCCCPAEKPQNLLFKNKYGMSTLTFHGVSWLTQTFKSAHDFIVWVHTCLRRLLCLEESGKSLIFQVCMYLPLTMYTRFFHHLNLLLLIAGPYYYLLSFLLLF